MSLPLEGIRVLDLARVWAVPGAAMHLADQGADVIKVEPPGGDECRRANTLPLIAGESRAWWLMNRNKRGIVVDARKPGGLGVLLRLAESADVLLQNFRPGVADRMGIGYEALRKRNPRLIYLAFSAYGDRGPYRNHRGYDLLIQAASGIMGRRSMPDGSPRSAGIWAADMASTMLVAQAVTTALFHRERTGDGQRIDTSLLQTAIGLQMTDLIRVAAQPDLRDAPDAADLPTLGAYRCADGRWLQLVVGNEAEWAVLCQAMGRNDWISDPRLATEEGLAELGEEVRRVLTEAFAARQSAEWEQLLREHDVPAALVLHPDEVMDHPQPAANGMFVDVDQPGVGAVRMMATPFRLTPGSGTGSEPAASPSPRPAPTLGQHTDEVLSEVGFSAEQIASLREDGAVQ